MRFYRVKQRAENKFIPQVKKWYESEYCAIEFQDNTFETWYSDWVQDTSCHVSTLEEAQKIIEDYKIHLKKGSKYPKYFKSK